MARAKKTTYGDKDPAVYRKDAYKGLIAFVTGATHTFPREILIFTSIQEQMLITDILQYICTNNCYLKLMKEPILAMRQQLQNKQVKIPIYDLILQARAAYSECNCRSEKILNKYDIYTFEIKYFRPRIRRTLSGLIRGYNQRSGVYKLFEVGCLILHAVYKRLGIFNSPKDITLLCSEISIEDLLGELKVIMTNYPQLFSAVEYKTIANALKQIISDAKDITYKEVKTVIEYQKFFETLSSIVSNTKSSSKRKKSRK